MAQGVGQLDIGIGQGAAQVFNPNPAIQQYAQNLAQNKAKHEAEVKQLGDELAKGYDPAGLRNDADKSKYAKKYYDIRAAAIAAENEKDPTKKAFDLADVRKQLSDLGGFVETSKKLGIKEVQAVHDKMLHPYMYSEDSFDKIKKGMSMAADDPNMWKEGELERGVDPSKVNEEFQKNLKNWANTQKWQDVKRNDVVSGNKGQWTYQKREIPLTGDNGLLEDTMNYATSNKDFQKYLHDTYPNIKGNDEPSTLSLRATKYLHDKGYGNGYYEDKDHKFNKEKNEELTPGERLSAYHWKLEHNEDGSPKYGATAQSNTPIYRQAQVDGLLNNDKDEWNKLDAKIKTMPEYQQQGLKVEQDIVAHNGHKLLKITIPEKVEYSANKETGQSTISSKIPEHAVFVDITDKKAGRESMNQIINQLFPGEKVDTQSLETPGGKKHIGTSVSHKKVNDPLGIL